MILFEEWKKDHQNDLPEWIPFRTRPITEDELEEWANYIGVEPYDIAEEAVIYLQPLPKDGQTVLITNLYGDVVIDTFESDIDGIGFEENGDLDGYVAWMPMPEAYQEKKTEKEEKE